MARMSRVVVPKYPHHVTQGGVRSMAIFQTDEDRRTYLQFLAEETKRFEVEILAWCLMKNHVHFIAVPGRADSLARAFGEAHRRYTRMKNAAEGVRGYLFQGRFSSCVLDERHFLAGVSYVEMNPVQAGLARKAWGYEWSSASFHTGRSKTDPLVKDRRLRGLVKNWEKFLRRSKGDGDGVIRQATRTGRPAGDGAFVGLVERLTGRDLSMGKAGRPTRGKK
jgi:putative transposase